MDFFLLILSNEGRVGYLFKVEFAFGGKKIDASQVGDIHKDDATLIVVIKLTSR